jgi:DNA-binding GntR family transcriptional regulator|tara:strand:+ start:10959 stop:11621 length:663 start_codon:yes stop_codon:yes gene_type:complete
MANQTHSQRVRDLLEDAIVKGRFLPGEKLDTEALAQEFLCSRTPLREALQQLEVSGLVNIESKRGTFVSRLDVSELAERFEVMSEIEGICARLAARRITPEELAQLEQAHKACKEKLDVGDIDAYYYENTEFHACIYHASHNSFLAQEAIRLHAQLHPYRRIQLKLRNRMQNSLKEHELIVQKIRQGDEEGAMAATKHHVKIQGDGFNDFVASLKSMTAS